MRSSEWIGFLYFLYIALCSWIRPLPIARRLALTLVCLAAAAAIWWIAHGVLPATGGLRDVLDVRNVRNVRSWAPLATMLLGYYVSGALFTAPSLAVESWLMSWDRRLLGDPATRFAAWPRLLVGYLEVVYMGCFVLIGLGFLILSIGGHASLANRYWTMVVGAELGSFGALAFVQTRPPWALERKPVLADPSIHRLALEMNRHFTIQVNTFPSGHVAGSLAVAIAVATAMPAAGVVLFALSVSIALACVIGRYHYIVDVAAGAALAVVIAALTIAAGA